jgi:membrane protease YdiL (CAAX protease family)
MAFEQNEYILLNPTAMTLNYSYLVQLAKVGAPIIFMLQIFGWAKRHQGLLRNIQPIILARIFSGLMFFFFAIADRKGVTFFSLSAQSAYGAFATVSLAALAIMISYRFRRTTVAVGIYPEIKTSTWSFDLVVTNCVSWVVYLFGYEAFFRGFLLEEAIGMTSAFNAIALNVIVYALSHFPKGIRETTLSIPFGILLCAITLRTGSIWSAFIIHTALAVSSEWFCIRILRNRQSYQSSL